MSRGHRWAGPTQDTTVRPPPPAAVRRWPSGAPEGALPAAAVSSASFSVAHVALMVICFIWYGRRPVLAPVAVGLAHLAMSLLVRLPSPRPTRTPRGFRLLTARSRADDGELVGLRLGDAPHADARVLHRRRRARRRVQRLSTRSFP